MSREASRILAWISALSGVLVVIIGGWFALGEKRIDVESSSYSDQIKAQLEQIKILEARVNTLYTNDREHSRERWEWLKERQLLLDELNKRDFENGALKVKIALMEATISREVNYLDLIEAIFDEINMVIWIKSVVKDGDEIHFPALLVNRAYEQRHGISRHAYKGRTVFDMPQWIGEAAEKFHASDLELYREKRSMTNQMCFPGTGRVWRICTEAQRFYVKLPDGSEIIGGVAREISRERL